MIDRERLKRSRSVIVTKTLKDNEYLCRSKNSRTYYSVSGDTKYQCECLDHKIREKVCKHIIAVMKFKKKEGETNESF